MAPVQLGRDLPVYEVQTGSGSERVVAVLEKAEWGHPNSRSPFYDRVMELMDETEGCYGLLHEPLALFHPASWYDPCLHGKVI